jgi:hypothetical protein
MRPTAKRTRRYDNGTPPSKLKHILNELEYWIIRLLLFGLLLIAAYDLLCSQVRVARPWH